MAVPLVLIFQELAQAQVTPTTPDLSTVIVGPAYDLLDYPDDAEKILLDSAYGSLESDATYVPPVAGTDAVVVPDQGYPEQSAGSLVDHASVRLYLRLPHVILGSTYLSGGVAPVLGASFTTSSSDRTLVTITTPTVDFVAAGVRPGDRIMLTSSLGSQHVVRTVQSVGDLSPSGLVETSSVLSLRLTSALPDSGSGADQWTYDTAAEGRVERTLVTQELLSPPISFPETGTDKLVLTGGVVLPVSITVVGTVAAPTATTATVNRAVSYAQIYLGYRALRQDLQGVESFTASSATSVSGVPTLTGLGKIDARNPLAVGVSLALLNAGTMPIYAYGVVSNDETGHLEARGAMESRRDLYCFVPLTDDINIHAAYKSQFEAMADPNVALATNTKQKFRIVLGSISMPVNSVVYAGGISGVSQQPSGAATGKYRTLSVAAASTGTIGVESVLPGDSITIGLTPVAGAWQNRRGTHVVGHVNSSKNYPNSGDPSALEVVPGSTRWDDTAGASSGDVEVLIKGQDGTTKVSVLASASKATGAGGTLGTILYAMKAPTVVGGPYSVNYVTDAGVASATVTIVGFAITVTVNGSSHTHTQVAAAVNTHPAVSALLTASVTGGGGQTVAPASQTRTQITGQTGAAASIVAGAAGGHVRVTGVTGMTAASVGNYLTISGAASGGNNGTFLIAVYTSATSVDVVNGSGVTGDANNGAITWTEYAPTTNIVPVAGSATTTVAVNDDMFNRLEDTAATFMSAGVKAGDTIQIPLDPNDYGASAFTGRVLTYKVASVLNENRLLIANGSDDTGSLGNELPHYFERDYPNRYIDNVAPNAVNYRVVRALTKDETVLALVTTVQSARSKRLTVVWPDSMTVSGLRDGSLPRAVSSTATVAGKQPGWALACTVGGVISAIPVQAGLTNGSFIGVTALDHAQGYFREEQLGQLSDGGLFVCYQETPGALPICLHQLTTDTTALETGELSVVKNIDFLSKFYQAILETFLGQYNVLPETQNEISRAVQDGTTDLKSRKLARVGAPLLEGTVTSIGPSDFAADRIEMYFRGKVARPLNTISFHLVA